MRVAVSALVYENESADKYFLKILMCYKNCGTHNGTIIIPSMLAISFVFIDVYPCLVNMNYIHTVRIRIYTC